ncbi:unnamed protein product [Chironomus riparius]|uniref:Uncharacterized protein n=1 Tax=Chironomus riparius TaxID=315576 RepID=A0A9P0NM88_9DIPT|nr:unnamed protein product [Chironomus riparius]
MNLLIKILTFHIFMYGIVSAEISCADRAKKVSVNMTDCCQYPDLFDMKIFNETYEKVLAEGKAVPATPLFDCLVEQALFKSLKFIDDKGNLDAAKINQTISEVIKDPVWKSTILNAMPKCLSEVPKIADKYQTDLKISKNVCDVKFDIIADCVDITAFMNCPESSWIKSLPKANETVAAACENTKSFIKDCYSDIKAFEIFLENQKD